MIYAQTWVKIIAIVVLQTTISIQFVETIVSWNFIHVSALLFIGLAKSEIIGNKSHLEHPITHKIEQQLDYKFVSSPSDWLFRRCLDTLFLLSPIVQHHFIVKLTFRNVLLSSHSFLLYTCTYTFFFQDCYQIRDDNKKQKQKANQNNSFTCPPCQVACCSHLSTFSKSLVVTLLKRL